jgi:hypothetical protein
MFQNFMSIFDIYLFSSVSGDTDENIYGAFFEASRPVGNPSKILFSN